MSIFRPSPFVSQQLEEGKEFVKRLCMNNELQPGVVKYIDHLDMKLKKGKPVVPQDSFKRHHCTFKQKNGQDRVDPILQSQKIKHLHEGQFPGAYVSTHPE